LLRLTGGKPGWTLDPVSLSLSARYIRSPLGPLLRLTGGKPG